MGFLILNELSVNKHFLKIFLNSINLSIKEKILFTVIIMSSLVYLLGFGIGEVLGTYDQGVISLRS